MRLKIMIKIRATFIDTNEGSKELEKAIKNIEKNFYILNKSKVYKGRNGSRYNNVYIDIQEK